MIASDATFTMPDADGLQFAVISSAMFIEWQRMVGGALESRLRFAKTLTWYTFPLPKLEPSERRDVIEAGKKIQQCREEHGLSLTELYARGKMPDDLVNLHTSLDKKMDDVFGMKPDSTVSDRQSVLFESYLQLKGQSS